MRPLLPIKLKGIGSFWQFVYSPLWTINLVAIFKGDLGQFLKVWWKIYNHFGLLFKIHFNSMRALWALLVRAFSPNVRCCAPIFAAENNNILLLIMLLRSIISAAQAPIIAANKGAAHLYRCSNWCLISCYKWCCAPFLLQLILWADAHFLVL